MKIKEIKCPSCNANISLKENATKGVCEYCNTEFIIDDGTIKIEHTGTIEITDDTSLKIAHTTLNQFKDYDNSLLLYKRLLFKYAHKKEVYIGLIRSITKDFKSKNIQGYQLSEINDYWNKYISLATDKEIAKYEDKINETNKNYWHNTLINMTNNFDVESTKEKPEIIEVYYNNYTKYCDKNEKAIVDNNYKKYISSYKKIINDKEKKKKNIKRIIAISILVILSIIILLLLTDTPIKKTNSINLSEINENIYVNKNYEYFEKFLKSNVSDIEITNVKLNNEEKSLKVTVSLKNILVNKTKTLKFKVNDDMGPIITPTTCSFKDTETVNVYECFTIYDFTDGKIEANKATVNTDGIDFKTQGEKLITVTIKDKDGNENTLKVPVIITKTPIELNLSLEDQLIVGNTHNISYTITPNNISDTSVSYTYNKDLITINGNKITALKKGQTEVCATSNYDQKTKKCKTINLELQCKDKYTFTFDGSKKETITSNEVFCPGTYRIYASVLNPNDFYHLKIKQKNEFSGETLTIFKNSSHLNQEGSIYVLTEGYEINTEIGITSVTLVKQK